MRFIIFHLILFFLSLILCIQLNAQPYSSSLKKNVEAATVTVESLDADGHVIASSPGCYISTQGQLVTLRHILKNSLEIRAIGHTGDCNDLQIDTELFSSHELVQLRCPGNKSSQMLNIAAELPDPGEHVTIMPDDNSQPIAALVLSYQTLLNRGSVMQVSIPGTCSIIGAPVLTLNGDLTGFVSFEASRGQHHYFVIPVTRIASSQAAPINHASITIETPVQEPVALSDSLASNEFFLGLFAMSGADYDRALTHFKNVVNRNPLRVDAWFQIGYCANILKRHEEAARAFEEYLQFTPDNAEAHYNLGVVYSNLNRLDHAVQSYTRCVELKPEYLKAHYNLAVILNRQKQYRKAIAQFQKVIDLQADNAEAYFGMGLAFGHLQMNSKAMAAFKQALSLRPDYVEALIGMGLIKSEHVPTN